MKKFTKLFALAALLIAPFVATAQAELTVADGTATNSNIPVYGLWTDAAQHNQILYPADSLEDMVGGTISGMTFYMSSQSTSAWGTTVTISLATTEATTVSSLITDATLTQVWTGVWNGQSGEISVEFADEFTYESGNLLVDITTTEGTYGSGNFYGVTLNGASICTYEGYSGTTTSAQNFLPKTMFSYIPGSGDYCYKPKAFVANDITNDGATISWTQPYGGGTAYAIFVNGEYETTVTDTFYTVTGLEANTMQYIQVKNVCGEGDSSSALSGSFKTLCANGNCEINITGVDAGYGYADVYQNGGLVAAVTSSGNVEICNGDSLIVLYHNGSYTWGNGSTITIRDAGNTKLVDAWNGANHTTGDTIIALTNGCPSCMPPANLHVSEADTNLFTMSWDPISNAESYILYLEGVEVADYNGTDTFYTFTIEDNGIVAM